MKRSINALPMLDIMPSIGSQFDYVESDYHLQPAENQQPEKDDLKHNYLQELVSINSIGKDQAERNKIASLTNAYEKLMAKDDILWKSIFGM